MNRCQPRYKMKIAQEVFEGIKNQNWEHLV